MADGATSDRIEAIRGVHTLEALYEQAGMINVTPGWLRRDETSPAGKQQSEYVPAHWRYDVCKAALDAAGRLIDVSLADRRNLIMCNPLGGNGVMTTMTLVAAYQMILPGEKAPAHGACLARDHRRARGVLDGRWREDADGDGRRRPHAGLVLARARP